MEKRIMKSILASVLVTVLLGGAWGVFTYFFNSILLDKFPFATFLFYPLLLAGIAIITPIAFESRIPFKRSLFTGLISGFIYSLLSPAFPFLSSVLAGASLGGGLVDEEKSSPNILNRLLSTLKGIVLFPVFVYAGSFINDVFSSNFFIWLFWGGWIGLGIFFICTPLFRTGEADSKEEYPEFSEVGEFKSEAQEILRELNDLESGVQ
jgi:hypothetical protein